MITNDPRILGLAFIGGIIPSLLWLWFWLKEEESPEPVWLLTLVFILGMIAVVMVLPVEKFIQGFTTKHDYQLILWAAAEEVVKYLAVLIVIAGTNDTRKPIDWPIYIITAALGFAALENALFLIRPVTISGATVALLTGQLRFMGSTLLHTVSSGVLGIAIGLATGLSIFKKIWHLSVGFLVAIALHTAFNFFIIRNNGNDFLKVFAFLWVVTIIVMLLFEKVRRMSEDY